MHSIAISADRRLFVVDRGHERMQVFDEDGNFLDMWPGRFCVHGIHGSSDGRVQVDLVKSSWVSGRILRSPDEHKVLINP